jgi:LysM repeat protein
MNNQSPLVPQGSSLDQKTKGRARVKIAIFFVLAVHGVGLLALLLQGCHREDSTTLANQQTNSVPAFDTNSLPTVVEPTPTPPPSNSVAAVEPANPPPTSATEYAVASHDTYSTIAKKFGVSVAAMKDANPGVEATKLQIGQKLHIPAPTKTVATAPTGNANAPAPGDSEQMYKVQSGDTLIKIASTHHTNVKAIRAANNLKSDRIVVGQKLRIPGKRSAVVTETASNDATTPLASR